MGTEWLPFSTAAVVLIDALVSSESEEGLRLSDPTFFCPGWVRYERANVAVDAVVAALQRSLLDEGGSMVAQQLHLSGLRALGCIAYFSDTQAHRILYRDGLVLGVKVLSLHGADEEAAIVGLRYLTQVCAKCSFAHRQLESYGAAEIVRRTMARYPRSESVKFEAVRALQACQA